jgi:hypothetical protein
MPKFSPKNLKAQFLKHIERLIRYCLASNFLHNFRINPALHRLSWMSYINFVHFRFRTVQRLWCTCFYLWKKHWTVQYGLIMEQMSCARLGSARSGETAVVWRAAPIILQVNVSSGAWVPDKIQRNQFPKTFQKITTVAVLAVLSNLWRMYEALNVGKKN